MSSPKWSCPAGTGVCVVNTVFAATASIADGIVEPLLHQRARAFEHQERGMTFVDVPDGGLELERLERAHAAHAEHDLLLDAHLAIAAVELMGDVARVLVVLLQVRVEQVQADMAAARVPHLADHAPAGQIDVDAALRCRPRAAPE